MTKQSIYNTINDIQEFTNDQYNVSRINDVAKIINKYQNSGGKIIIATDQQTQFLSFPLTQQLNATNYHQLISPITNNDILLTIQINTDKLVTEAIKHANETNAYVISITNDTNQTQTNNVKWKWNLKNNNTQNAIITIHVLINEIIKEIKEKYE